MQQIHATPPKCQQFLGLTGYYRNHINHYADTIHTLTHLTRKAEANTWIDPHQKAFTDFKRYLQRLPILIYPDPSKPCYLFMDATMYCLRSNSDNTHPTQNLDDLKPITFISRKFSDTVIMQHF